MKQTVVKQLGFAFRQWQKDWENYEKSSKNKPKSFDEFIKPFLEMEKQQIINACNQTEFEVIDENGRVYTQRDCKVELSYQDDSRTLKVFIKSNKQD